MKERKLLRSTMTMTRGLLTKGNDIDYSSKEGHDIDYSSKEIEEEEKEQHYEGGEEV